MERLDLEQRDIGDSEFLPLVEPGGSLFQFAQGVIYE